MKIVAAGVLTWALVTGLTGVAYAQSANLGANGTMGLQAGGGHGAGLGMGLGGGTASPGAPTGAGVTGRSATAGATGSARSGPALNTMRANGTSLNMNPDPRAPNVTGKPAGSQ